MDRNTTGVIALGGAIVLLIGLIIAVQSGTFGESDSIFGANEGEDPLLRECLADHSDLAAHYHPLLTITVNGDQMRIDPNTGIGTSYCPGGNMHLVHVHDSPEEDGSTKLHVEHDSSVTEPITLGLFFDIWGVEFSSERIGTFTVDAQHELIVRVDGVEVDTYEDTPLEDLGPDENGQEINQRIEIIYREIA